MSVEFDRSGDTQSLTLEISSDDPVASFRSQLSKSTRDGKLEIVTETWLYDEPYISTTMEYFPALGASSILVDIGGHVRGPRKIALQVEPTIRRGGAVIIGVADDRTLAPFAMIDTPISFSGRKMGTIRFADGDERVKWEIDEDFRPAFQNLRKGARDSIGRFELSGGLGIFDDVYDYSCQTACYFAAMLCGMGCAGDVVCTMGCLVGLGQCLQSCDR